MSDAVTAQSLRVNVVVEIPRGSFLKRGSSGRVDFVSPFPCPFNYGSVPEYIGMEGDLLDAVVLGRRLPRGTQVSVTAWAAVGLDDRGLYDDKLICSARPLTPWQRRLVGAFFRLYALSKHVLNASRGQRGRTAFAGWHDAQSAVGRAVPRDASWQGPSIGF